MAIQHRDSEEQGQLEPSMASDLLIIKINNNLLYYLNEHLTTDNIITKAKKATDKFERNFFHTFNHMY